MRALTLQDGEGARVLLAGLADDLAVDEDGVGDVVLGDKDGLVGDGAEVADALVHLDGVAGLGGHTEGVLAAQADQGLEVERAGDLNADSPDRKANKLIGWEQQFSHKD